MNQKQIEEDGPVAGPTNVTAGVEGTKLPIKPANVFKRVQALKKKKNPSGPREVLFH